VTKAFRYVYRHRTDGDIQYEYFTLEEIEAGKALNSVNYMREDGYKLIARNAHTGFADMDGEAIYEDDLVEVMYNGLGTQRVTFENGLYSIAKFNTSKYKVVGTIYE
jgi:hypothetical protein